MLCEQMQFTEITIQPYKERKLLSCHEKLIVLSTAIIKALQVIKMMIIFTMAIKS